MGKLLMIEFFGNFPLVEYDDKFTRNLIARASLVKGIVDRFGVFYPYRVKDHERADTIAFDYYGDSGYWWLVYFANGVVDPRHDWPLSDRDFDAYIKAKYGSYELAHGPVRHYLNLDTGQTMTPETRTYLPADEKVGFDVEVSYWTWEHDRNEERKTIRLLSKRYARQAQDELRDAFGLDRG
jgi:hypothetical protein